MKSYQQKYYWLNDKAERILSNALLKIISKFYTLEEK